MFKIRKYIVGLLLAVLFLLFNACSPPWHGEEDNYPVVVLMVYDSTGTHQLSIDEVGIDKLYHLENDQPFPISGYNGLEGLSFDSRLDDQYDLILPLDKKRSLSSFVLERNGEFDTLSFVYQSTLGVNENIDYDFTIKNVSLGNHTLDSVINTGEINHPQIYLEVKAIL